MKPTVAEENYLKAIYKHGAGSALVSTNTLAAKLRTTPASVTDMLKKLADKDWVRYTPYHGAALTEAGLQFALDTIRKHRLWETFLVDKLRFGWDEVHEAAEQLEHIDNPLLIHKLDEFLGFPEYDPHGEPIPDAQGKMVARATRLLADCAQGSAVRIAGVLLDDTAFLQHLDRIGIRLGIEVVVLEKITFDESLVISLPKGEQMLSVALARNITVW